MHSADNNAGGARLEGFGATGGAVRSIASGLVAAVQGEAIGDSIDEREAGADNVGVLLNVIVVLGNSSTDTMLNTAEALTFDSLQGTDTAVVGLTVKVDDADLTGLDVDFDSSHHDGVSSLNHVAAQAGVAVDTSDAFDTSGGVLSAVLGGDAFGNHLIIGTESAVFLAHSIEQLVGGIDGGKTVHVVGTAAGRGTGVRDVLGVVLNQLNLVRTQSERTKSFEGVNQRTDIGALAKVFPAVELGDGAVRIQLEVNLAGVVRAAAGLVNGADDTNTVLNFVGGVLFAPSLDLLVLGTQTSSYCWPLWSIC